MAEIQVVRTNDAVDLYPNATINVYTWKKLHVIEKKEEDGLIRCIEHGYSDSEWKEVHVYNE